MQICINLPHVFHPGASQAENATVLRILLEAVIAINTSFLQYHPDTKDLYTSGVYYKRTKIWEPIPALYARGYGDCKSLTAALIAQYRKAGIECRPVFRWKRASRIERAGNVDYHILVQTAKGFEDPSKVLGMGRDENAHFRGEW